MKRGPLKIIQYLIPWAVSVGFVVVKMALGESFSQVFLFFSLRFSSTYSSTTVAA